MHCDRYLKDSEGSIQGRIGDRFSERDEKEAKYWTRKLYEFEANDPDRYYLTYSLYNHFICLFLVRLKQCFGFSGGVTVVLRSFIQKNLSLMGKMQFLQFLMDI